MERGILNNFKFQIILKYLDDGLPLKLDLGIRNQFGEVMIHTIKKGNLIPKNGLNGKN